MRIVQVLAPRKSSAVLAGRQALGLPYRPARTAIHCEGGDGSWRFTFTDSPDVIECQLGSRCPTGVIAVIDDQLTEQTETL